MVISQKKKQVPDPPTSQCWPIRKSLGPNFCVGQQPANVNCRGSP